MEQPPEDIVVRQDEQAKAIAELSCQLRLLTQRVEAGFAECSEADHRREAEIKQLRADLEKRIDTLKTDLTGQINTVSADMIVRDGALKSDLTAQINTVKSDLTARIDAVERKLDFYARIFLTTNAALVAALVGKIVQWW